jgi:hypothetical protein
MRLEAHEVRALQGMEDKAAALALGNWARRNEIHIMFEVRRVSQHDVL